LTADAVRALVAHPGTQYAFRLAAELHRLDALWRLHTGVAFSTDTLSSRLLRVVPRRLSRLAANRHVAGVPPDRVRLHPAAELLATALLRRGGEPQATLHRRNARFQQAIPRRELAAATAVVGFDTSSWILARRCADVGVPLILDQSIGHPDSKIAIFENVRRMFPAWDDGIEPRLAVVRRAEQIEHDAAKFIVAASSFTRGTLLSHGVPEAKIRLNPYGVDARRFVPAHQSGGSRPFRFLFVGAVNARKGVPLLLQAWDRLPRRAAELWLVGPSARRTRALLPERHGLNYLGPVPHTDLPELFAQCDVLVFPSYFEGFGLVILEAMACGLPVIASAATAAPDIYSHGDAGWIIAPGDIDQLVSAMSRCLDDRSAVAAAGRKARTIAERFTWEAYGRRWLAILREATEVTE
jgi:glycosyltransferase involved in cell wall biosynthesis